MFDENFSFAAQRSPSLDSSTAATTHSSRSGSISPCNTTSAPFPQPFSVSELATQLAGQRIQRDSQICYDSCDTYANDDNDADWSIPVDDEPEANHLRRSQTFPQRPHSPSRRAQRQMNTRLLCTTSHRSAISALVARMVESEDQCSVIRAESLTPPPAEVEDEGYNSSDEAMTDVSRRSSAVTLQPSSRQYRRASELMSIGGACISKPIRQRKERHPGRQARASERS